jgi:hypothetical protein
MNADLRGFLLIFICPRSVILNAVKNLLIRFKSVGNIAQIPIYIKIEIRETGRAECCLLSPARFYPGPSDRW